MSMTSPQRWSFEFSLTPAVWDHLFSTHWVSVRVHTKTTVKAIVIISLGPQERNRRIQCFSEFLTGL